MGLWTNFFLGFLLFCECMFFSQQASVYRLQPKYPAVGDKEGGSMSSFASRDASRIGRRLQAVQTIVFRLERHAAPNGLYFVNMSLGNPPKPYFLEVDSGSDPTWVRCDAPCINCGEGTHPLYVLNKSLLVPHDDPLCAAVPKTGVHNHHHVGAEHCYYGVEYYDDGSSMGVLVRDRVLALLTNRTLVTATSVFGCGYDQQGSLVEPTARMDGLLGLGSGMESLPSQWAKQGLIKNVIGHCFSGGGRHGGYLFLGDDLVPTSASVMTWVPRLSRKYYDVGPPRMMFGEKPLDRDGDGKKLGRIIFDSGSSDTYFTNQAYGAFLSAVKENLHRNHRNELEQDSSDPELCWRGRNRFRSVAEAARYFKSLTLKFGSAREKQQMEIFPEGYLVINERGNVCLAILNGTKLGIGDTNILGDISLQRLLVVYDNEKHQIGWARSDCKTRLR